MKKLAALLVVVLSLLSCSKDSDVAEATGDTAPKAGLYRYTDNDITVDINVGAEIGAAIYNSDGLNMYRAAGGIIKHSSWPTYEYAFNSLVLLCTYSTGKSFSAYVDLNATGVNLPVNMQFVYTPVE